MIKFTVTSSDVVAPALTPDSYTSPSTLCDHGEVVAPALTPDSYTPGM